MINNFLKKVRKAPWVLGQRLTKKPTSAQSVISDLFIWRCSQDWNTYFELLDIACIFGDHEQHQIEIIFFNDIGIEFYRQSIKLNGLDRQILDISDTLSALAELPGDYGTFAVFHQKIPIGVSKIKSFLAERGYVSYQYKNASLRSYMHGNLDAIDNTLKLLGGSSFISRRYNLQYLLEPNKYYEIALVNASLSKKIVELNVVSFDGEALTRERIALKSGQVFILTIKSLPSYSRLIVRSKMIMARPTVFCFNNYKIDVFHG